MILFAKRKLFRFSTHFKKLEIIYKMKVRIANTQIGKRIVARIFQQTNKLKHYLSREYSQLFSKKGEKIQNKIDATKFTKTQTLITPNNT